MTKKQQKSIIKNINNADPNDDPGSMIQMTLFSAKQPVFSMHNIHIARVFFRGNYTLRPCGLSQN